MGRPPEIYALSHPATGEVRYIGKANCSKKRLASHIRDSRRRDTPLYRWVRKLASEGLIPNVSVLVICDGVDWRQYEIEEIEKARKAGLRLLNVADGGDEPFCPPEVSVANGLKRAHFNKDYPNIAQRGLVIREQLYRFAPKWYPEKIEMLKEADKRFKMLLKWAKENNKLSWLEDRLSCGRNNSPNRKTQDEAASIG